MRGLLVRIKEGLGKVSFGVLAVLMGMFVFVSPMMVAEPVAAADCTCPDGSRGVPTAILGTNGCSCSDKDGSGIKDILKLVVEIMTVGVGILGVIGITVVGLQYLTAGGSEEQTRKAKRRMFEIVIGIVAYVVIFALLRWLIPGFKPFG